LKRSSSDELTRIFAEKFLNLLVAFVTLKINLEPHNGHLNKNHIQLELARIIEPW
jgi:hypothetical protein